MTEAELHVLLGAHEGRRVCLSYRVDARGYVRLRREPARMLAPVMLGALAVLMAACAGYLPEAESPGWTCRDPDGYEVTCVDWRDHGPSTVPEALDEAEPAPGCPVRPTAEAFDDEGSLDPVAPGDFADPSPEDAERDGEVMLEPNVDVDPDAPGTGMELRANFSIDPEAAAFRGIVVGWSPQDSRTGRLRYVPTATLWEQWRERRAERKAARERRRLAARG